MTEPKKRSNLIVVVLVLVVLAVFFGWLGYQPGTLLNEYARGLALTLFGVALVVFLSERLSRRRESHLLAYLEEQRRTQEEAQLVREEALLKNQLIREISSGEPGLAARAIQDLDARGWLTDGTLTNSQLAGANLQGARLGWINLSRAFLNRVNLQEADLSYSNLSAASLADARLSRANLDLANLTEGNFQGADMSLCSMNETDLTGANLSGADLSWANLNQAILDKADLTEANLSGANLEDARLHGASLSGAFLYGTRVSLESLSTARSLANATMPDGTRYEEWARAQAGEKTAEEQPELPADHSTEKE